MKTGRVWCKVNMSITYLSGKEQLVRPPQKSLKLREGAGVKNTNESPQKILYESSEFR